VEASLACIGTYTKYKPAAGSAPEGPSHCSDDSFGVLHDRAELGIFGGDVVFYEGGTIGREPGRLRFLTRYQQRVYHNR
jgi:hypothetical protein